MVQWAADMVLSCRIREHITGVLRGHEQEVCGLKWSPSGTQLASGGNDNLLHVWSATGAHMALFPVHIAPCFRGDTGPWFCQWLS